jgi:hypothetical protein
MQLLGRKRPLCKRPKSSDVAWRLADHRSAAIGENDRATGLDYCLALRRHDVRAKIEFASGNSDDSDHNRGGQSDHDDLEVGSAVCGVQRPIHVADEISSMGKGLLYLQTMHLYEGTSCLVPHFILKRR